MAKTASLILREQLMAVKPLTVRLTIPAARAGQDALGELGARANRGRLNFTYVPFEDFQTCFIQVKRHLHPSRIILYLHGGGYTAGSLSYAKGFGSILAVSTHQKVFCVAYRLAPEDPFPAALEDACAAYQHLLSEGWEPQSISLAGESAGGGLIFALCLYLRQKGLPLPGRLVALSPWTDLTCSGDSYTENEKEDPTLSLEPLRYYAGLYAGENLTDPLVSPLYGELSGLPPTLIIAGGAELLRDDAVHMAERLVAAQSPCRLHVEPGMWHVYPLYSSPDAKKAIHQIRDFLQ